MRLQPLLSTLPVLLLLSAAIFHWTAGQFGGRLIQLGELSWTGYGTQLRRAPEPPQPPPETASGQDGGQDAADADTDTQADEPKAAEATDDDLIDDLLGDLDDAAPDPEAAAQAARAAEEKLRQQRLADYERQKSEYASRVERRTPLVRTYAAFDRGVEAGVTFINDRLQEIFVFLVVICAVTASVRRHHIALRTPAHALDDRVAAIAQILACGLLLASVLAQASLHRSSGVELEHPMIPWIWAGGFAAMIAVHLRQAIAPMTGSATSHFGRALLCVPLYAWMGIIAGSYFVVVEAYFAGLAVYLEKLAHHYTLYMQVGLYVWAGMLLKRTRVADAAFLALRPLSLSAESMIIIVVLLAAFPTAYSGASGIFVIAAGATIFSELRQAGARPQLAVAASAMAGSLGVVLRPCLLVVIIAYLNPVSSDELFHWGTRVYLVTGALFAVAVLWTRRVHPSPTVRSDASALPFSRALRPILSYVLVFVLLTAVYALLLGVSFDLHSAPMILPVVLLLFLPLDTVVLRRAGLAEGRGETAPEKPEPVRARIESATSEASHQVGALLLLMGVTVCLGGVIERMNLMSAVPDDFGAPVWAMATLVVLLVLIGMSMEPYGAVILVSGGLAQIAYQNGINPVHFWMVVLVAFELGYLTPPVALNQLLIRQVIGEEGLREAVQSDRPGFWWRHERILLPVVVMATALLLVAFVPLTQY